MTDEGRFQWRHKGDKGKLSPWYTCSSVEQYNLLKGYPERYDVKEMIAGEELMKEIAESVKDFEAP